MELDRPIFLSVGYAACHWCHVMERESFEDTSTAAMLNAHFVAIKVDREERPDIDALYMGAVQAITGQGGWPMSVFLTPEGRPFFGGTYFPDEPRHGMPSFRQVLDSVRLAWFEQRAELEEAGSRLVTALAEQQRAASATPGLPARDVLDAALTAIDEAFDPVNGGWGRAPKFPQPMTIEALLRRHAAGGPDRALEIARRSLDAMAAGGVHDQLGGGFHRYSTDAHWLVPHFEQMLYDNAQLARVYLHAWSATADPAYLETFDGHAGLPAARAAHAPTAGSRRARTRTPRARRGPPSCGARRRSARPRATMGRWPAPRSVPPRVATGRATRSCPGSGTTPSSASSSGCPRARSRAAWRGPAHDCSNGAPSGPSRHATTRCWPAWNGLAIAAFADAARALSAAEAGHDASAARYREAAVTAAGAVTGALLGADGRLRRSWKDGRASADGVLEDYADLADGLLATYEATGEERWFSMAVALADMILDPVRRPGGWLLRHRR